MKPPERLARAIRRAITLAVGGVRAITLAVGSVRAITLAVGSVRAITLAMGSVGATTAAAGDSPAPFLHRAPIVVEQAGAFVLLPLPPAAYGHVRQPHLQDLRIVDAAGQRVPFAVLQPRAAKVHASERQASAALYPLPARQATGAAGPLPLRVVIQGERVTVTPIGKPPARPVPAKPPPGWLIDLGERERDAPAPHALRLAWSGPAEFSIGYRIEHSADLQQWHRAGSGQLMALSSDSGALTQPLVSLPENVARFVRLVWHGDPQLAPALSQALQLSRQRQTQAQDAAVELSFMAGPEPAGPRVIRGARSSVQTHAPPGTLHFDLGGDLPLLQIDLQLPPPAPAQARVVPVRVQARSNLDVRWRELARGVVYRIERDGSELRSPPLAVHGRARYLRVTPDERAAALDPAQVRLQVQAALASIVFASQGETPLTLLAGSPDAAAGALPVASVVPALEDERERFGQARLGPWTEAPEAAAAARAQRRWAALRPWLLWAVLLGGVASLSYMVWRLAAGRARE